MAKNHIQYSYAFSAINKSGQTVHPSTMKNSKTGEVGFRVTPPNKGNTEAEAITVSETEMIKLVKENTYQVRCRVVGLRETANMFKSELLKFNSNYIPLGS